MSRWASTEVHSLTRGSSSNNGHITAAATNTNNKFGYLFWAAHLSGNAPAKTVCLGRPWRPGGDVNAIAQVLYRGCAMDAHIRDDPWTDMSGFSWKDARFFEYSSVGTGAVVSSNRPQMSASTAASYTPTLYLAGTGVRICPRRCQPCRCLGSRGVLRVVILLLVVEEYRWPDGGVLDQQLIVIVCIRAEPMGAWTIRGARAASTTERAMWRKHTS